MILALALTTSIAGCSSGADDDEVAAPKTPPSPLETLTVVSYPGYEIASHPSTQSVSASSHELTWDYFDLNADFTHTVVEQGSRTLTDAEFRSITDALAQVQVTHNDNCGADAGVVTLDVQNEDGIDLYANDFYAGCPWQLQDGRTFAKGLEDLANVTGSLVQEN